MNKIKHTSRILYTTILYLSLLLIGSALLALLLTYNPLDSSLNSTTFNNSVYGSVKNIIADVMFQIFGISAYMIPIFCILWSYKIYRDKKISWIKYRLICFMYALVTLPPLIHININDYNSGILGLFLYKQIPILSQLNYVFLLLMCCALLFALAISYNDIIVLVAIVTFCGKIVYQRTIKILKGSIPYTSDNNKPHGINIVPDINNIKASTQTKKISTLNNNISKIIENNLKTQEEINTINFKHSLFYKNIGDITPNNNVQQNIAEEIDTKAIHHTSIVNSSYSIPLKFLNIKEQTGTISKEEIQQNVMLLEQTIQEFGIKANVVNIQTGPVVTLYEVAIPAGVKSSKLTNLETDIALRMKAISVRIAIVPGQDVVSIEIPNKNRKTVYLKELLQNQIFQGTTAHLPMALGHDIYGKPIVTDLATMPHLLIAGTTGSGKSVGVNGMILSLLYKLSPERCKLIMIDPKMLELSIYQDIPHLLTPVVTNAKQAVSALKWAVKEMEYRYYQMSLLGVRNLLGYNEKIKNTIALEQLQHNLSQQKGIDINFKYMPYIVIVIDEMADLMMVAGKEVEFAVQRLAQMARAAGIHLIMATQRPSVDVITGTIKANFPTRMSFQVSSKIDSRTILGEQGAEQLLGRGDLLLMSGVGRIQRLHGPFIADDEVANIVDYLKQLSTPNYIDNITSIDIKDNSSESPTEEKDGLYSKVIEMIINNEEKISTSFIQRKFQIGYNRAARIIEQLEEEGVISRPNSNGKRELLVK